MPTEDPAALPTNPALRHPILDQNLTFTLGSEHFGIQVLHIKDSVPAPPSQTLASLSDPRCAAVIPVPHLSLAFDFKPRAYTDRTCIVVRTQPTPPLCPRKHLPCTTTGVGPHVLPIPSDEIELAPDFGDGAPLPSLLGMARIQGQLHFLSDPHRAFPSDAVLKLSGD